MLYLISGASRSGKTMLARTMLRRAGLPYLSTDWLVMGFTDGMPGHGIHDKLLPREIAEGLWTFLEAMFNNMLCSGVDYIIEGEAMLPHRIRSVIEQHPNNIRCCFMGYTGIDVDTKLAEIQHYSDRTGDWLTGETDHYIRRHIANMISHSREIESSCAACGIRYFDTSAAFLPALAKAEEYLLGAPTIAAGTSSGQ